MKLSSINEEVMLSWTIQIKINVFKENTECIEEPQRAKDN